MASIYDWSRTAADNDDADSGINWAEGQTAASVNDSARTMMARFAEFLADFGATQTTAGTANAQTLTARSSFTAYATGIILGFKAGPTNTGAATLNVNGIGAKAIRKVTTAGEEALAAGDVTTDGLFVAIYDAAANSAAGAWMLINPAGGASVAKSGDTMTGRLTVPYIRTATFTIANNAVDTHDISGLDIVQVHIETTTGDQRNKVPSGAFRCRASATPMIEDISVVSGDVTVTTGALTGTTGTNGGCTISTHTDGNLYIENRSGASRVFNILIIG